MTTGKPYSGHRYLCQIASVSDHCDSPDRLLLERFALGRDEEAFVALVKRHRALVWGVCWRSLRHAQDAEDCFQATFVVLARRAGSIRWQESVANWLYGVASRVAAEAKAKRARHHSRERQATAIPEETFMADAATRELCTALDEELRSLPPSYREPLLLRYLEGRTTEQAARQLGWSQRTFERRLARGLERLRDRLTRRGLSVSGVLLAIALTEQTTRAAVPSGLVTATINTAVSRSGATSATVLALAHKASKGMTMAQLKLSTIAVVLLGMTIGTSLVLGNGAAPVEEPASDDRAAKGEGRPADAANDLARRTWAILDVVEKNHRQPPSRHDVILKGVQSFLKTASVDPPKDLAARVKDVVSEDKFAALLRDLWPAKAAAQKLEAALLEGMFESIPGKPLLMSAAALKVQDQLRGNRYVGTGVQISANKTEKLVQIDNPFRRGPARKAGALPGDLIVEVDGKSTAGATTEEMVQLLRGPEGTKVTIVVRQPGETKTRTLEVTRGVIPLDSTFGFKRTGEEGWDYVVDAESRIAYVWVKSIGASTLQELKQVEARLEKDGMRALVLDFRHSRGDGHLHDAGLVAGGFLDGHLMWTTTDSHDPPKPWRAGNDPLFRDWPIAVLINEIEDNAQGAVLAALQDNRRAVLVGESTKTDGAVRRLFPLPNQGGNITVLTGQLERADKTRDWPVRPDRPIELDKPQRTAVEKWLMTKPLPVLPPGTDDKAPADPQLDAALKELRSVLKKNPAAKEGK